MSDSFVKQTLYIYFWNIMVSTTQTVSQIKSQEFIGHIQKYIITSPLAYVTHAIQSILSKLNVICSTPWK